MSAKKISDFHGGLVGINYIMIEDSYAVSSLKGGAICGINQGNISRCYGNGSGERVAAVQRGKVTASWQVKKTRELQEKDISAWDFDTVWTLNKKGFPVFHTDTWYTRGTSAEPCQIIKTADQLLALAERIGQGDREAAKTNVRLSADINLKNKKIRPIGTSDNPYTGEFDGAGYTISNFRVRVTRDEEAGLFGFITKARLCNLTVKGTVYGGSDSGLLCGVNDLSEISCCSAIGEVHGYGYTGGLCGNNRGMIRRCNFYGYVRQKKRHSGYKLLVPVSVILLLELGAVTVLAMASPDRSWNGVYKPVVEEKSIKPIENDRTAGQTSENNSITIKVESQATYSGGDELFLKMSNPSSSNQNAVMEVLVAKEYISGEIGYEEARKYNAEYEYLVVAKTGAVPPGYLVEQFEWLGAGKEALPPGKYPAFIQVFFYNAETNEKSLLDSLFEMKLIIN